MPLSNPNGPELAAWVWLTLVTILIVFEVWATITNHVTLSQWVRMWNHKLHFIVPVGAGSLIYLIYHLFFVD